MTPQKGWVCFYGVTTTHFKLLEISTHCWRCFFLRFSMCDGWCHVIGVFLRDVIECWFEVFRRSEANGIVIVFVGKNIHPEWWFKRNKAWILCEMVVGKVWGILSLLGHSKKTWESCIPSGRAKELRGDSRLFKVTQEFFFRREFSKQWYSWKKENPGKTPPPPPPPAAPPPPPAPKKCMYKEKAPL